MLEFTLYCNSFSNNIHRVFTNKTINSCQINLLNKTLSYLIILIKII